MKIAIITSGLLPVPSVKGGAIETLLDTFVSENEKKKRVNIDLYSLDDNNARTVVKNNKYKLTNYIFINSFSNVMLKVFNKIFKKNVPINKFYQKMVVSLVNKRNYDYVIIENYPELVLNLNNLKTIVYVHSDVFNINIDNCNEILEKCHKVITVSDFIKDRVIEIDSAYKDKVFTVYNSIDFDQMSIEDYSKNRLEIREKYGINKDDFVYVFSGRISEEKGPLELVKAFNKINVPNKKLLIVGGIWYGVNKKNKYLEEMMQLSDGNVIYTGYINHGQVQNILCATDVGVVPSICNEAAGLSVVEFMNAKNIVVASNMGGISEYLNKNGNYLVDYENKCQFVDDLAAALETAYVEKEKNEFMKQLNVDFCENFTVSSNYDSMVDILKAK